MTSSPHLLWLTALVAVLSLLAPEAHAQTPAATGNAQVDEARTRFSRGVDLYKEGDYRAAIIEFKRAYELAPNFRVLFNLGQAHQELQDYAAALDAFERYLKDGGAEVPPDRAALVKNEVQKLLGRVATVAVEVNVADATVSVDDTSVGSSPLAAPVRVSAGRRKVSVSKAGYQTVTQVVELAGRDHKTLSFELAETTSAPVAPSRPTPAPPQDKQPEPSGMSTGFWVGMGVTAALAVSAGVVGFAAIRAKSDHEDQLDTLGTSKGDLDDSRKKVKNLALAADILAGSALVAGTLTVIFATGSSGEKAGMRVGPTQASLFGTF